MLIKLLLLIFITSINSDELKSLTFGTVEYLNISQELYKFNISGAENGKFILANIFSVDCNLNITSKNVAKINYSFNNDSFSLRILFIKSDSLFELNPIKENFEDYRECHLIVNTVYDIDYRLNFQGNGPAVFFFNQQRDHMELTYNYANNDYVTFSFLFDTAAIFNITILKGKEKLKEKIISSSSNIFLTPLMSNEDDTNLIIIIKRLDINENPVLMKFMVFTDNQKPLILQRNYLNYGFTTSTSDYQFFYMEIYKEEIGEIVLNDKRQNGQLMGKICKIDTCSPDDLEKYPDYENRSIKIHYNLYHFDWKETEDCEKGCYLLITYFHKKSSYTDNQGIILGYEFTLLSRIWNKKNIYPQIINIPYNEYIFGEFNLFEVNYHFYSIFVSNETDIIGFETKGNNFKVFMDEGKKKVDIFNPHIGKELKIDNYKDFLEINATEYKNKYISFTISTKDLYDSINSFYYFRLFQLKEEDNLILPLDSNIESICKPKIVQNNNYDFDIYASYVLLKNNYNEFSLNYSIFSSNQNRIYNIILINANESAANITQKYLNKLINKEKTKKFDLNHPGILTNEEKNNTLGYILAMIIFYSKDIVEISSNFDNNETEIYPQIYSSGIYQINAFKKIYFYNLTNFSLTISCIYGEGEIENFMKMPMKLDKNYNGKPYSTILSNDTYIKITNNEQFILYLELKYLMETNNFGEIMIGEPLGIMIKGNSFPIYYTVKLQEMIINFNIIDFYDPMANFTIEGMKINDKNNIENDIRNFKSEFKGVYDISTKVGFLQHKNMAEKNKDMLIKIDESNHNFTSNILIDIIAIAMGLSKNDFIPINQFIRGSLDYSPNHKDEQNYYISYEKDLIVIEFSKNNEKLKVEISYFDNDTIKNLFINPKIEHGMEKYEFQNNKPLLLIIRIYFGEKSTNSLSANYILRYYYKTENYIYNFNEKPNLIRVTNVDDTKRNDKIKIFTYEYEKLKRNSTFLDINNYITFINLYSEDNLIELLNTSAIVTKKPIYSDIVSNDNYQNNNTFQFSISINGSSTKYYKYILQIRIVVHYMQNLEFLVYSSPVDLSEHFKDFSILTIILSVVIVIVIIILIIIVFKFVKEKRKSSDLREQVLSISFSTGQDIASLNNGSHTAEKDKDYETTFI